MDTKNLLILLLFIGSPTIYGAEHFVSLEEQQMQEALRLSLQEFQQDEELREVMKRSKFEYEQEAVEKSNAAMRAGEIERVKKEEAQMDQERRALRFLVPPATSMIVLYNANVPIESLELAESGGTIRKGQPRSPSNRFENISLWDVPVNVYNEPFILSVKGNGKTYEWHIESIVGRGKYFRGGTEFCLIQEAVPGGYQLKFQQVVDDRSEDEHKIELRRILSVPKSI